MYSEVLEKLDLAKNESKIYETLLREGESSIGKIASKAQINRRNVYDSMDRLIEKGLVFELRRHNENSYKAVDPRKLMEIVDEKKGALENILPDLEKLYTSKPILEEVYIYKGIEGWKNYFRDIIRIGEDVWTIGAKGDWADEKISIFAKQTLKETKKKKIGFKTIFDHELKDSKSFVLNFPNGEYKFLPKNFSTQAVVDVFGDHVVILSHPKGFSIENSSLTVIINQQIADSYRTWIKFIWKSLK